MVVDRLSDQFGRVTMRHFLDVDDDTKVTILREFQRPAFQELLRIGIEVAVMERRRIHRVEQFREFDKAQFDLVDGWMASFHVSARWAARRDATRSIGGIDLRMLDDRDRNLGCMQYPPDIGAK